VNLGEVVPAASPRGAQLLSGGVVNAAAAARSAPAPNAADVIASMVRIVGCLVVLGSCAARLVFPPLWAGAVIGILMMVVRAR
jgi:hypothetical protein